MIVRTARGRSSGRRAALLLLTAAVALGACGGGAAQAASKALPDTGPTTAPSTDITPPDPSPTSTPLVALAPAPPTTAPPTTVATTAPPETSPPPRPPTTEAPAASTTPPPPPPPASAAAAASPPQEPFVFEVSAIGPDVQVRMVPTSWRAGCPVPLEELRYLRVSYWGFDDAAHVGELVVNASATDAMRAVFARLYSVRFPIRQMRLVDDYGGDDSTSIEADNTSAFNCRQATGSTNWSQHALGLAIDVNPIENPYIYSNGTTDHPASAPYLDRSVVRPGMAVDGGPLVAAFDSVGWGWGGRWASPIDYQHFSANGR